MAGASRFLDAILAMDLNKAKQIHGADPACICDKDEFGSNAMHICVLGGVAKRRPDLMKFLLDETDIDLLHENGNHRNPLEEAFSLNDQVACDLLEERTHEQLNRRFPLNDAPALAIVRLDDPGLG
jgi:hypothetical protein